MAKVGVKFCKIVQDDCLIIQHVDNEAQLYCRKAGYNLYFTIFLPDTRNYVYCRISVDYGRRIFSEL